MISVFEPSIGEEEINEVVAALRAGEISGSFGKNIPAFEEAFATYCGCRHGIAVSSGTTALHLAVDALDLEPGSEILVSASTNIATGLAAFHNGMVPVGVDSEETTWNLDLDLIESLITPKTKAIIPVHLFGHPVDMDRLNAIAAKHSLKVIEDAAEAHGAECRGRRVGSFGDMSCFSFYANKLITTGEGGMVLTNDDALAERLRLLRNLAFTVPRFKHQLAGYNFRMTGYQAAMGKVQVTKLDAIIEGKRNLARMYQAALGGIPWLNLPAEMPWAKHVYWMYSVAVKPGQGPTRDQLAKHLKTSGIDTRTFFYPMNHQPCFEKSPGFRNVPSPVADRLWETGLYLPSSLSLTEKDITFIADAIRSTPF